MESVVASSGTVGGLAIGSPEPSDRPRAFRPPEFGTQRRSLCNEEGRDRSRALRCSV